MSTDLVIVGAGAHGRKLWHYATSLGLSVVAFVDDNPQASSPTPSIPCLSLQAAEGLGSHQRFVVAIGNAAIRRRLQETLKGKGWLPASLVHPTAYVAPDAILGEGCVVGAQAIVETGSKIGTGTIVDAGSVVDHDCVVGIYCHLKPGSMLQAYGSLDNEQTLAR